MPRAIHGRRVLLFLVAVLLPLLVLVALGLRGLAQERELAEKRVTDERARVVLMLAQELESHLERLATNETGATAERTGVVAVAQLRDGRLLLPWDLTQEVRTARRSLSEPTFASQLRRAQQVELVARDPARAVPLYRGALRTSRDSIQAGYVRLLLARALLRAGDSIEAGTEMRAVLAMPFDRTDAAGMPLALYAAAGRLHARQDHDAIAKRLELGSSEWSGWFPAAVHLLRSLADTLAVSADEPAVRNSGRATAVTAAARVDTVDRLLDLQRSFGALGWNNSMDQSSPASPRWSAFGPVPWLVRLPAGGRDGPVPVIDAPGAFARAVDAVAPLPQGIGEPTLSRLAGPESHTLGLNFPGLGVLFSEATAPRLGALGFFYAAALVVVLLVALTGTYFLSRDIMRETQAVELRSQFVAGVSHELKTPLTAIRMYAETLRDGSLDDPQAQREYLETIVGESERLSRLLNNVLDFARIERGEMVYHPRSELLADVVEEAARTAHDPLAQQGFRLHLSAERDVMADVDRDAIEQAIHNLLSNAAKYSGASHDIELHLRTENGDALIEVRDRGIGIPLEEQARIFDRYYRAPGPHRETVPGTGLGLTLVRHVAHAHGGTVDVHSIPDRGSTFTLRLPHHPRAS